MMTYGDGVSNMDLEGLRRRGKPGVHRHYGYRQCLDTQRNKVVPEH